MMLIPPVSPPQKAVAKRLASHLGAGPGSTVGRLVVTVACALTLFACPEPAERSPHGRIAEGISGPMGAALPTATPEQLASFERGRAIMERRFTVSDGLGPAFNVTFCGACHERPTFGGSAGLYRNFFIAGTSLSDGSFVFSPSAGNGGGVVRMYYHGEGETARPAGAPQTNTVAQRNPVPFFGVGLIAEIPESEILRNADEFDRNGDGISGRPNYDQSFVGRFGRKAQTVSIEGFIRGPLFNHLGITSDPLSEEQKAALPVDSSSRQSARYAPALAPLKRIAQAAAPSSPLTDQDDAPDPEMSTDELFDLVSFSMLLAAPEFDAPTPESERGEVVFDEVGCKSCHTPRLRSARGPIPVYSDLLLHDMGPELADGLQMGLATGSEYRTQPLWGLSAVGPYLHDGRAESVREAILMHAGEAKASRDLAADLPQEDFNALLAFLNSLGGSKSYSPGLVPPGTPVPATGEYGGPATELSAADQAKFAAGRALFDKEHGFQSGLGAPRFNGDSCRACHFEPVMGGSGPLGVNVMRHGIANDDGEFNVPSVGTILHKGTSIITGHANDAQEAANIFEMRQTPHVFGLGLIESIPEDVILANADPSDTLSADGISGKPSWTDGGRLGRFGWKAQVPSVAEFVRDAVAAELGMTLPYAEGLTFGRILDTDDVPDPEMSQAEADSLTFFLAALAAPPRQMDVAPAAQISQGETVFDEVGCASCHVPTLPGANGPVALYSDLLLHDILPAEAWGIEEASATMAEFRTAPLWGLSKTAPYLHNGRAETFEAAILGHAGEATSSVNTFKVLTDDERAALMAFLESL